MSPPLLSSILDMLERPRKRTLRGSLLNIGLPTHSVQWAQPIRCIE